MQSVVGEFDHVVVLIPRAQPLEDLYGLVYGRLLDHYGLEAPLEGGVLFDVHLVFVQGGRTDALKLAARQGRLEDIGGVYGPLRRARSDDGVQFIDEDDDVLRAANLLHDAFEALLELSAVFRAGHDRRDIQRQDALVLQRLGDLSGHYALGEPLDNGGLADAGLAYEHRVVLCLSGKDANYPVDLPGPSHDRVEPVFHRKLGKVLCKLVEGGGFGFFGYLVSGHRHRLNAEQLQYLGAQHAVFDSGFHQVVYSRATAVLEYRHQEVLGADIVVLEPSGLLPGGLDDLVVARADRNVSQNDGGARFSDRLFYVLSEHVEIYAQALQQARGDGIVVLEERKEDVLRSQRVGVQAAPLGLGVHLEDLFGSFRKIVHAVQPARSNRFLKKSAR